MFSLPSFFIFIGRALNFFSPHSKSLSSSNTAHHNGSFEEPTKDVTVNSDTSELHALNDEGDRSRLISKLPRVCKDQGHHYAPEY
ncbi:hypothetical protein HAX54_019586 [Datura stramonium]|uniref:Uncharacterized protein n=1 Tax=Datura stramonium TaxID=4076 RepID=A0ABS8UPE7_DATST|nr:hypothetical protein [Datura stramonium]